MGTYFKTGIVLTIPTLLITLIEAHGLNPNAVKTMKEVDIDISNQTSDIINPEILNNAYLVVTLCGNAADKCPITPPHVKREHWGFDDTAKAEGSKGENGLSSYEFVMKLEKELSVLLKLGNNKDKWPREQSLGFIFY